MSGVQLASATEICNFALSHLGAGEISNFETEKSPKAVACRRFYDVALKATLRDFPWPFATKIAALGLVAEDPNEEWGFSYQYPVDCLKIRRILSGNRVDTQDTRILYKIAGTEIFTDKSQAVAEYTAITDDPLRYPPDFVLAFSLRLAAYVAPSVTGGDAFKLGDRVMQLYQIEISRAEATALNEETSDPQPDSSFILARN